MKKARLAGLAFGFLSAAPFLLPHGARADGMLIEGPTMLISSSTDSAENLATALRVATREGRLKEVERLLGQGADVNGSSEFGETALMVAARFNQTRIADVLLEHHAEINARDSRDNTALETASKFCSVKIGLKLLNNGADVNWINSDGKNALILAADQGCLELVQALVHARGVRLNQQDNSGSTALDYALSEAQLEVGGPYTEIVKILTKAGAKTAQWQIPVAPASRETGTKDRKLP